MAFHVLCVFFGCVRLNLRWKHASSFMADLADFPMMRCEQMFRELLKCVEFLEARLTLELTETEDLGMYLLIHVIYFVFRIVFVWFQSFDLIINGICCICNNWVFGDFRLAKWAHANTVARAHGHKAAYAGFEMITWK